MADSRERVSGGSEVINRVIAILSGVALLGAVFATPNVTRASSETWYVGPNTNVSGGSCEDPDFSTNGSDDHEEVQDAVVAATAGDTIILCEGEYYFTNQVSIEKDLTFIGAGEESTVIDGQDTTRLFNSTANLTLESMTLQNGNSTGMTDCSDLNFRDGGAVCVIGVASLHSTQFLNNYSDEWGGAVAAIEVRITSSVFTGNEAPLGGAVVTESFELEEDVASVASVIEASVFSRNIASTDGGAVWTPSNDTLTISRSQFIGNEAGDDGGAVMAGNLNVAQSRRNLFRTNVAGDLGGALYVYSNRRSDAAKLKRANRFYRNQSAKRSASDIFVDRDGGMDAP